MKQLTNPHSSPGVATFFAFSVVELESARVSGDRARPAVDGAEAAAASSFFEPVVPVDEERFCACVSDMMLCERGEGGRRCEVEALPRLLKWRRVT